jgi:hypothetical protein
MMKNEHKITLPLRGTSNSEGFNSEKPISFVTTSQWRKVEVNEGLISQ